MCAPLRGALRKTGCKARVVGRACETTCARRCGFPCFVGHSFGSAAAPTAAQAPACGGQRARRASAGETARRAMNLNLPPESNRPRPHPQDPRDHPARHIGGAEINSPQRPHPPKGARVAHRPRERTSSDDRPAPARATTTAPGRLTHCWRKRQAEGHPTPNGRRAARPGRSFGPQAVARRSDSRPQALAPGPGPST